MKRRHMIGVAAAAALGTPRIARSVLLDPQRGRAGGRGRARPGQVTTHKPWRD